MHVQPGPSLSQLDSVLYLLSAIEFHATPHCMLYREHQLEPALPNTGPVYNHVSALKHLTYLPFTQLFIILN